MGFRTQIDTYNAFLNQENFTAAVATAREMLAQRLTGAEALLYCGLLKLLTQVEDENQKNIITNEIEKIVTTISIY